MSVRITAAGAVALTILAFLTAPVSACDERFIKKCERAAAAAAAAAEEQSAPVAKRKSAGRVQLVISRRGKLHFAKRTHAPRFASRGRMVLASSESRLTSLAPESALARRFRGFIDPRPMSQNAFEVWRKPHVAPLNLEPPASVPAESAPVVVAEPVEAEAPQGAVAAAKQDRVAPKAMELASAESRPVMLPDQAPVKAPIVAQTDTVRPAAQANIVPQAAQVFVSEAPPASDPQPNRFSIHQLVIALCGALGAAGALRFIVGA